MSNVIRISYTIADGNVWTEDSDTEYDSEASLDLLADQILAALHEAYPQADVTVRRENTMGGVRVLDAETDDEWEIVEDETEEQIKAVADGVWEAGDWYVKA